MGCVGTQALLDAGFEVAAIFTHPDSANENHFFGSVARIAAERGIPVYAPEDVNHPLWVDRIRDLNADVIFSFYYRNLLCDKILNSARLGAFNLHGSLLPAYRGRAPLNWVLVNGETETGVTLHRMVARADAGAIVAQQKVAIADSDEAMSLHRKLSEAAQTLLRSALPTIKAQTFTETAQDDSKASYYGRRTPEDGRLDWELPAQTLHNWCVRYLTRGRAHTALPGHTNLSSGNPACVTTLPRPEPVQCCRSLRWWWLVLKARWRFSPGKWTTASICRAGNWRSLSVWWPVRC